MAENSEISWTDHTFNPWQGCTKVSPGCAHCYAETLSKRWGKDIWGPGKPRVRTSAANWKLPLRWNREAIRWVQCARCGWRGDSTEHCGCDPLCRVPTRPRVFSASMADWLDDEVPIEWLADFLFLIWQTQNLDYLLLTKRPQNWLARVTKACEIMFARTGWQDAAGWVESWLACAVTGPIAGAPPTNVWMGTTAEDQARADERIPELLNIPARVRFLSCEPLLGEVDVAKWLTVDECGCGGYDPGFRECIHWVIAGGESGAGARPMHPAWARTLRDQCAAAGVAFHFKQWGEWIPICEMPDGASDTPKFKRTASIVLQLDGTQRREFPKGAMTMHRVGKLAAGRLLDGVVHDAFPEVRP